jgi:hypothetical protein
MLFVLSKIPNSASIHSYPDVIRYIVSLIG